MRYLSYLLVLASSGFAQQPFTGTWNVPELKKPPGKTVKPAKTPPVQPEVKKPPAVSLDKVLARIEALDHRYQQGAEKSKLPLVALSTRRSDALHANPDELRDIWAWLDKWERSYLTDQ